MPAAVDRRPTAYRVLCESGWLWASLHGGRAHLVPPEGDMSRCGRLVPRGARVALERQQLTKTNTCGQCRHAVQLP